MMTTAKPARVGLGPFVFDRDRLTLTGAGASPKLTPKAVAVLELLLAEPGRTVSRQQLFDAVWPGSFSSDEVLTTVVNELRRAFSDQPRQSTFIATVHKRGYRWCGPAPQALPPAEAPAAAEPPAAEEDDPPAALSLSEWSARWRRHRRRGGTGWEPYALVLATVVSAALLLTWLRGGRVPFASANDAVPLAPQAPLALPVARAIVADPGLDIDPDLARDGRSFVYVHRDPEHGPQLWLGSRVPGESARHLELSTEGRPVGPALAPDGSAIAFLWISAARCELRVLHLHDHAVRTLADGCPYTLDTSVDWSPDGHSLVFTRLDLRHPALANRHPALFRIGVDGADLRRLSHAGRWLSVDLHPRFSPDGNRIAFIRDSDGRHDLVHVRSMDGSDERSLRVAMWPYRLDWLDHANLLVSGHGQSPAEVWQVALEGGRVARLATTTLGPGLSVAAGTAQVLIEQRRQDDNLWRRSLADPQAMPEALTRSTRSERDPRLSPDGRQLAFLVDQGANFDIEVLTLGSGRRQRWSDLAPLTALDLRWAPDGRAVALVLGTDTGKRLAILDAPGVRRPLSPVLADLSVAHIEFAPDDLRLLLIATRQGRRELLALDWPRLAREPELVVDFSVSSMARDASSGVLWLTRAEDGASFVMDRAGMRRALPRSVGPVAPPDHWAIDRGQLLLGQRGSAGAPMALRWLDVGGRELRQLQVRPPEPPLGRPFELRDGWLWYGQRDLDESDLVELVWPGWHAGSRDVGGTHP